MRAAICTICEGPYKSYLDLLWRVRAVETGSITTSNASFGSLVSELHRAYPNLVDPDATFVRNAATHRHWRFLPDRNAVRIWNENPQGKVTRELEITITELGARVRVLLETATLVVGSIRVYTLAGAMLDTGLLAAMLKSLPYRGGPLPPEVDAEIQESLGRAFGDLQTAKTLPSP